MFQKVGEVFLAACCYLFLSKKIGFVFVLLSCIGQKRESVFCMCWTTGSVLKYNAKENTIGTVEKIIVQQKFKEIDF